MVRLQCQTPPFISKFNLAWPIVWLSPYIFNPFLACISYGFTNTISTDSHGVGIYGKVIAISAELLAVSFNLSCMWIRVLGSCHVLVEVEKTCRFSFTSPILFFVLRSLKVSTLSQVWFLEEEKIPVVSSSEEEGKRHKIMMKSPWEILQSPVGSGGVISLLSSVNIPENLSKMGVEYIEVRRVLSILFVCLIWNLTPSKLQTSGTKNFC